ncbi:MAG: 2-oxo-4-hydroxy-4-carboxy-5-ureidoimidazoline decarboxylase, partial [Acidobacteriaceae bacterium]|nr:2-oxo-4-hydroxy-4-carboxy-5-ureidoimidazoline decarboxylase [Acidobacteriaceae bacterium]
MTLDELNSLSADDLAKALLQCCSSSAWTNLMIQRRPFAGSEALFQSADEIWFALRESDWLEGFRRHPKIGEKSGSKWSSQEQAGMASAPSQLAVTMHELNAQYERKFGYIFIVCATGKSAGEMLDALTARVANSPEQEIQIAAAEQGKITKLRLEKLLA